MLSFSRTNMGQFTISQLAEASGVSVASIKYYLREGLLPSGDAAAERRAHYDRQHLERLHLIRVLRDVGQLPIATIAGIFEALENGGRPFAIVAGAMDALATTAGLDRTRDVERARKEVRTMLRGMGVKARADSGAVDDLATALVKLRDVWGELPAERLRPYAESARALAKLESDANRDVFTGDTETLLRTVVLGTVLFEPVLLALRRVMHEDFARAMLQDGQKR